MWMCDKFNDSTAKWFKLDQIGKSRARASWYGTGSSVRTILFSHPAHASSTREETTHSERQTRLCDSPNPSSSKTLSSPSRDHRPPSSRRTWRSRVRILSILHASPRRWLQTVSFTGVYNDNDPRIYDPSMYSPIHFARWTCVRTSPCLRI